MNESVLLKGYKNGLKILVTRQITYEEFIEKLKDNFGHQGRFFQNAEMTLMICGITLTQQQECEVISIIEELTHMKIVCLIDDDPVQNARFEKAYFEKKMIDSLSSGFFHRGNLICGQSFDSMNSIVIIGDVQKGARVVSAANIIIIGSLCGEAVAGINDDSNAYIIALDMNPQKIQINNTIARFSQCFEPIRKNGAKIAYARHERIFVDDIDIL